VSADLTRLVAAIRTSAPEARIRLRQGVVQAVAADGSCTVTIGGGAQQVAGVAVLASWCPVVGRTVWLATDGRDLFIVGGVVTPTSPSPGPAFGNIRQASTQSIPNANATALSWSSRTDEVLDGVTASASGLTIATPGIYQVHGSVVFAANATGARYAQLLMNGNVEFEGSSTAGFATTPSRVSVSTVIQASAGDVINLAAFQSSGAALGTVVTVGGSTLRLVWVGAWAP
jgi:hypothetical protein